jgi:hypothetical protein
MMDLETRFELYETLFEHPGWELLIKEFVDPELEGTPERAFLGVGSMEELSFNRGVYHKLWEIKNLQTMIENQKELYEQDPEHYGARTDG